MYIHIILILINIIVQKNYLNIEVIFYFLFFKGQLSLSYFLDTWVKFKIKVWLFDQNNLTLKKYTIWINLCHLEFFCKFDILFIPT